jgi:uncharacterized membrane protein
MGDAADLKFLHSLLKIRTGTSRRKAAQSCCGGFMSVQEPVKPCEERNAAIAVWLLYLAGYLTLVTFFVGLGVAYLKRVQCGGSPYASHMTSAIYTFWITASVGLIGFYLSFFDIGIPILVAVAAWLLYRCLRGLVSALNGEPIEDPTGWL